MTPKQQADFNKMRNALIRISKYYDTPSGLRKQADKVWGLSYEEALEMAYENIQQEAKQAVKGVKDEQ